MTTVQVQKLHTFTGHTDCVYTLAAGPSNKEFFSAGGDGRVVKWDNTNPDLGEQVAQLPNSIYAIHYEPSSGILIAGHNYDGIHLIDVAAKRETGSLKLSESAIFDIVTHDGNMIIASGDGTISIVDPKQLIVRHKIQLSQQSARSLSVAPDGADLAVGYSDHSIRVFDLRSFELKNEWRAHTNSVFTVRYSASGDMLYSGSRDARLKAWNARDGYKQAGEVVAHMFAINHIALSPDGKHFVTCSLDKSIKLWDADQLRLLKVVDKARHAGHATSVNKCLWTPGGDQVISASDDRKVSVWKFIF